jgi:hypothetical protein
MKWPETGDVGAPPWASSLLNAAGATGRCVPGPEEAVVMSSMAAIGATAGGSRSRGSRVGEGRCFDGRRQGGCGRYGGTRPCCGCRRRVAGADAVGRLQVRLGRVLVAACRAGRRRLGRVLATGAQGGTSTAGRRALGRTGRAGQAACGWREAAGEGEGPAAGGEGEGPTTGGRERAGGGRCRRLGRRPIGWGPAAEKKGTLNLAL